MSAQSVNMRSPVRKITGPRPMVVGRSSSQQASPQAQQEQPRIVETSGTGTVRRKPVGGA